jgi:uncharacterized protein (UPF0335 family)
MALRMSRITKWIYNLQLLVYADDVNRLSDNIDTILKSTETLIGSSKKVGLDVKAQTTKQTSPFFTRTHGNS